jgi:hypothetical protein
VQDQQKQQQQQQEQKKVDALGGRQGSFSTFADIMTR